MDVHELAGPSDLASIADESTSAVLRWLNATGADAPASERRLAELLAVPGGADFAREIVDGVLRPRDAGTVGRTLERLSHSIPPGIRRSTEIGTHLSAGISSISAGAAVSLTREAFLRHFSHLLLRLDVRELEKHLAELIGRGGIRPTLAPVATRASGQHEANRHIADLRDLLLRDEVEAISFHLPAAVGRWRLVDMGGLISQAVDQLEPLYGLAAVSPKPKFIELAVSRYDELEASLFLFERMLQRYPDLDMGIALPDALPDSLLAMRRVAKVALSRRAHGGAVTTVRISREDSFAAERVVAEAGGWVSAAFDSAPEARAHYIRLLDFALQPVHSSALRVISSTHDLFVTAFAWRLARDRGMEGSLEHEFRLGVASEVVDVVKRDVGGVRLHAPVLHTGRLSLAAPYLLDRIDDLSGSAGGIAYSTGSAAVRLISLEQDGFMSMIRDSAQPMISTRRNQQSVRVEAADFTQETTRDWALGVLERAHGSVSGEDHLARNAIKSIPALEQLVSNAVNLGALWGERRGSTRAAVLDSVADVFAEWRSRLAEVAVSESGILIEEADSEVTVAIALARSAARDARSISAISGAVFVAPKLVVVASPRSCAVASLAGTVLSALAAGAAVIVKSAPESTRITAVFIETLVAGGVPEGLVSIVEGEGAIARALVVHERVDRVVHTGSRHAAKRFHSWSADTVLSSTTGGRNSMIVAPSADLESAVADIVHSAFDHGGQAPTATSAVILVGSVGESARFLGRLADAVNSVPTGPVGDISAGVAALARVPGMREIDALDTLREGEEWRVRPRQLDEEGRLWSPGLRVGVIPESMFGRQERRAPVLDVVRVASFDEALAAQNAPGFGLAAGLYSLDEFEIETWLDSAQAGVLCVNRPMVVGLGVRVPVGGWNRSVLGKVPAVGGPDAALVLGTWEPVDARPGATVTLDGVGDRVSRFVVAAQAGMSFSDFDWVRAGARSDESAWMSAFSEQELTHFLNERNVQRYEPLPVTIRLSEGAPMVHLVRVLAAAAIAGAPVAVSSAVPLHAGLIALFSEEDSPVDVAQVLVESDTRWHARVHNGETVTERIRLIGGDPKVLARVLYGQPGVTVYAGPVTTSGRVELLTFVRAQSLCIFGLRSGLRHL